MISFIEKPANKENQELVYRLKHVSLKSIITKYGKIVTAGKGLTLFACKTETFGAVYCVSFICNKSSRIAAK